MNLDCRARVCIIKKKKKKKAVANIDSILPRRITVPSIKVAQVRKQDFRVRICSR